MISPRRIREIIIFVLIAFLALIKFSDDLTKLPNLPSQISQFLLVISQAPGLAIAGLLVAVGFALTLDLLDRLEQGSFAGRGKAMVALSVMIASGVVFFLSLAWYLHGTRPSDPLPLAVAKHQIMVQRLSDLDKAIENYYSSVERLANYPVVPGAQSSPERDRAIVSASISGQAVRELFLEEQIDVVCRGQAPIEERLKITEARNKFIEKIRSLSGDISSVLANQVPGEVRQ